jgi:hypothetical protein
MEALRTRDHEVFLELVSKHMIMNHSTFNKVSSFTYEKQQQTLYYISSNCLFCCSYIHKQIKLSLQVNTIYIQRKRCPEFSGREVLDYSNSGMYSYYS